TMLAEEELQLPTLEAKIDKLMKVLANLDERLGVVENIDVRVISPRVFDKGNTSGVILTPPDPTPIKSSKTKLTISK
ncbi:hypothetical protein HAX54_026547, partial [Datura stramonium]|nr:hypothetical protein [Datura stramonium]